MSTEITSGKLYIDNIEVKDSLVVDYFERLEKKEVTQRLREVLRVGVIAIQAGDAASQTEVVQRRFEKFDKRLDEELDDIFGKNGKLPELLEHHLGDNGRLTELFDPHKDGTPIAKLRKDLSKKIQDFRETMLSEQRVDEALENTPVSGFNFEDKLWEQLELLGSIHGDKVEKTGEKTGTGDSKKGDFVVEVNGNGPRFVIEAKDTDMSNPAIKRELDKAIPNREAVFGVLLTKERDHLNNSVGWFNEYEGNHLVAAVTDGKDDKLFRPIVRFVYSYARARALSMTGGNAADIDFSAVRAQLDGLNTDLTEIKQIKTRCTKIKRLSNEIEERADEMRDQIKQRSSKLISMLDPH